jgi:hypothetical protein
MTHVRISWCDWDGETHDISCVNPSVDAIKVAKIIIEQQRPFVLAVHVDGMPSLVYAPMDIHQ